MNNTVSKDSEEVSRTPEARITKKGISLNWHALWIILGFLGMTGGGLSYFRLVSPEEVDIKIEKKVGSSIEEHSKVHEGINDDILEQKKRIMNIEGIVVEVQTIQHWQAADQAAERVSTKAPKSVRIDTYKRLFEWNIKRLKKGQTPCSNLECTND